MRNFLSITRSLAAGAIRARKAPTIVATPNGAYWSPKTRMLADKAYELATARREDRQAVEELMQRASSRGGERSLAIAANNVRFDGRCNENEFDNRAWRLLTAAAEDRDISVVDDKSASLFDQVTSLKGLSLRDAFIQLAILEPRLYNVERFVLEFAQSQAANRAESSQEPGWRYFEARLQGLVGQDANGVASAPLLSTFAALDICFLYLGELLGSEAKS